MKREKILVGFGDPERARDAVALAAKLEPARDTPITLVGVVPAFMFGGSETSVGAEPDGESEEAFRDALAKLAAETGSEPLLVRSSSPARGIFDTASEFEADLVVLGSSEKAGFGRSRAGRVAMQLLQGGHTEVALAPVGFAEHSGIETVGVAVDGSSASHEAVEVAVEICQKLGARPRLISVAAINWSASWAFAVDQMTEAAEEAAQKDLGRAASEIPSDLQPETAVHLGDPATALVDDAKENVQLLCLGSRGYGPIKRVLLGSVSSVVVREAPCAILVVPSPEQADGS